MLPLARGIYKRMRDSARDASYRRLSTLHKRIRHYRGLSRASYLLVIRLRTLFKFHARLGADEPLPRHLPPIPYHARRS